MLKTFNFWWLSAGFLFFFFYLPHVAADGDAVALVVVQGCYSKLHLFHSWKAMPCSIFVTEVHFQLPRGRHSQCQNPPASSDLFNSLWLERHGESWTLGHSPGSAVAEIWFPCGLRQREVETWPKFPYTVVILSLQLPVTFYASSVWSYNQEK